MYLCCQRWNLIISETNSHCSCWEVVTALAMDCDNIDKTDKLTRSWYINELDESVPWLTISSLAW